MTRCVHTKGDAVNTRVLPFLEEMTWRRLSICREHLEEGELQLSHSSEKAFEGFRELPRKWDNASSIASRQVQTVWRDRSFKWKHQATSASNDTKTGASGKGESVELHPQGMLSPCTFEQTTNSPPHFFSGGNLRTPPIYGLLSLPLSSLSPSLYSPLYHLIDHQLSHLGLQDKVKVMMN